MPSLWSWFSKGRHKINSSKNKESTARSDDRNKQRDYSESNKRNIDSNHLGPDRQSLVNGKSLFDNVSSELKVIEPVSKDKIKDRASHGEELRHQSTAGNGRLPAYKIFGDEYKPVRNVGKDINSYQPSPNSDNFSSIFSQNERLFSAEQEKENAHNVGVEMRPKKSDLFEGVASKFHRYSLQFELPRHESDVRKRPEFLKSETMAGYVPRAVSLHDASAILSGGVMAGYVPRAVSLHDASAILSGGVMDEASLPKQVHSKAYDVPNSRENRLKLLNGIPKFNPSSSNQQHNLVITGESSKDGARYLSRNNKQSQHNINKQSQPNINNQSQPNNNKLVQSTAAGLSKSRDLNVKSSSTNENFYFSSPMLKHIQGETRHNISPWFTDANSLTPRNGIKETAAESGVSSRNMECGNNSRKKDSFITGHEDWNNKSHSKGSPVINPISDLAGSIEIKDDNKSDGDASSVLAHLDKVDEDSSCPIGASKLEALFNTDSEFLY